MFFKYMFLFVVLFLLNKHSFRLIEIYILKDVFFEKNIFSFKKTYLFSSCFFFLMFFCLFTVLPFFLCFVVAF